MVTYLATKCGIGFSIIDFSVFRQPEGVFRLPEMLKCGFLFANKETR